MTVLNTANDGYFNVLIVLYRAVVAYGKMPRDRLLSLCAARADVPRLRQTLSRWTEFGLFTEDGDQIMLAPDVGVGFKGIDEVSRATTALPATVRRIVFREQNNERFWDSADSRCADLTRGLAWLLAQNIYSINIAKHALVQDLESQQLKDAGRRIVQNDVRWNGLLSWGRYLGFVWHSDEPMPDPTAAIHEDLPLIFGKEKELTASVFLQRVSATLPVLDRGQFRVLLEDALDPIHWQAPTRPDLLSTALSRALWRLDVGRILKLDSRADAKDSWVLQRSNNQDWRRFTHVRLEGTAA